MIVELLAHPESSSRHRLLDRTKSHQLLKAALEQQCFSAWQANYQGSVNGYRFGNIGLNGVFTE